MTPTSIAQAVVLTLLAAPIAAWPAATTDGSTGAPGSLSGAMQIPQSLGTVRGTNLFHSFARFSVANGESATFIATDPGLRHVIARVTGGEASLIAGPLSLRAASGSRPDFWFINPAGITVGEGGSFDVPGGLHLGAASRLRLADGSALVARSSDGSSFSIAAPEQFGFLGDDVGALIVQGALLRPAPRHDLSLAGARIELRGAALETFGGALRLQSPGEVRLLASYAAAWPGDVGSAAGRVHVDAGSLTLGGSPADASLMVADGTGAAGAADLAIHVDDALTVHTGSEIVASTSNGLGTLTIDAGGAVRIDGGSTGAAVYSNNTGAGSGPALRLTASSLELLGGGLLYTAAQGTGSAGALDAQASRIHVVGRGSTGRSAILTLGGNGTPGALTVVAGSQLQLSAGATIGSSSRRAGTPGPVQVQAPVIVIDGGGEPTDIGAVGSGDGVSAPVLVQAGQSLRLSAGGRIYAATLGSADGASVQVQSPRMDLVGDGHHLTGIDASALGSGRGSAIRIDAGQLTLSAGATVSTDTIADGGAAGSITVRAERIDADGRGLATTISSYAWGARGDAGNIDITARERVTLLGGASLSAGTQGVGNPGTLRVRTATLHIDGRGADQVLTGVYGDSLSGGAGAAVDIEAGLVDLRSGGSISTSTASALDGQPLLVVAQRVHIDGSGGESLTGITADTADSGHAGSLTLRTGELRISSDGLVSTSTLGSGRGGTLRIDTTRATFELGGGLASVAGAGGDAGQIDLRVGGRLDIVDGGFITANTGGAGAAGTVSVHTGQLLMSGVRPDTGEASRISSRARDGSGGQAGNITVTVGTLADLQPGALLSIANDAGVADPDRLAPSRLQLRAGEMQLHGAEITAAATANAPAGEVRLESDGALLARDSVVRTSAHVGNGGRLTLVAGGRVQLRDSQVTTSVTDASGGNGGDISIDTAALVLQSGFVQANTAAAQARGGRVTIDTPLLLPDGSHVFVGGSRIVEPQARQPGFNVIQAAAPDGVAGRLTLTQPELNLSAGLAALNTARLDFGAYGRDLCGLDDDSTLVLRVPRALTPPLGATLRLQRQPAR